MLDGEGCGSYCQVQSSVGGTPLADTTVRVLNQSMEQRNDSSLLCSDSEYSSVTSHSISTVNKSDLQSLQEKVGVATDQCNDWIVYYCR